MVYIVYGVGNLYTGFNLKKSQHKDFYTEGIQKLVFQ